jgi:tetratricopeptide (TPR) repeat protein/SAM-dependent methyltransferase
MNPNERKVQGVDRDDVEQLFSVAMAQHQRGQLAQAEHAYRRILETAPDHAGTLHCLGVLVHQRGRTETAVELIGRAVACDDAVPEFHYNLGVALEALNRFETAATHYCRAISLKPDYAKAYLNLANVLLGQERLDDAQAACYRAAALEPGWPDAPYNLGVILARRGRFDEAITQFLAVLRLRPDHVAAHNQLRAIYTVVGDLDRAEHHCRKCLRSDPRNHQLLIALGLVCLAQGKHQEAFELATKALQIEESPQARYLFTRIARHVTEDTPRFRQMIGRALVENWSRPSHLMAAAVRLIKANSAIRVAIGRQAAVPLGEPSITELCGTNGLRELADDRLLCELMHRTPICDSELERLLTSLRRGGIDLAIAKSAPPPPGSTLQFFCALARQCFINEYIYAVSAEEHDRTAKVSSMLTAAFEEGRDVPPLWVALVGAYMPLHRLASARLMAEREWPAPLTAVVRQQIIEPDAQRPLRAALPILTAVDDATSIKVKQQYEENPFPRWTAAKPTSPPERIDVYMRARFPRADYQPLGKERIEVLIAGCGTGQHAVETSQRFAGADVLAVDLSAASLGYALHKTLELGLTNIRYGVADILKLNSLAQSFDVIEASGVLHHLADPWAGWRVLLSLLRPGGVMNVGLYSESARSFVVRARAFIAEGGYPATADGIRRCRQAMRAAPHDPLLKVATEAADFFSMSECRDLLFHVQEHRMTLPQIAAFVAEAGVKFLGFDADAALLRRYSTRFPEDRSQTDLACWHRFEMENPSSFAGMYQFWIQKPQRDQI